LRSVVRSKLPFRLFNSLLTRIQPLFQKRSLAYSATLRERRPTTFRRHQPLLAPSPRHRALFVAESRNSVVLVSRHTW
jgi:hypothetical protein